MANFATLSDLLSGCATRVKPDACSRLFAAVTPPKGSAPTDTLTAAQAIARYPWYQPERLFRLLDDFYPVPAGYHLFRSSGTNRCAVHCEGYPGRPFSPSRPVSEAVVGPRGRLRPRLFRGSIRISLAERVQLAYAVFIIGPITTRIQARRCPRDQSCSRLTGRTGHASKAHQRNCRVLRAREEVLRLRRTGC